MTTIEIDWQGPFPVYDTKTGESILTHQEFENKPGIYLWCYRFEQECRIIYVGQSKNLVMRIREHISNQLNGNSIILDPDVLHSQGTIKIIYTPAQPNCLIDFLKRYDDLSQKAFQNLVLSFVFFAIPDSKHIDNLMLIESAIINLLQNHNDAKTYIQNSKVSKKRNTSNPICVISSFQSQGSVVGLNREFVYG